MWDIFYNDYSLFVYLKKVDVCIKLVILWLLRFVIMFIIY